MYRKINVHFLCGGIFTFLGLILFVISIVSAANLDWLVSHGHGDVKLLPLILALTGGVLILFGFALIFWYVRRKQIKKHLIQKGEYIFADITGFQSDYKVRIQGRPTFRIDCSYQDSVTGTLHIFRSETVGVNPVHIVTQTKVRVYVDKQSGYRNYYVDIDSILPNIKTH